MGSEGGGGSTTTSSHHRPAPRGLVGRLASRQGQSGTACTSASVQLDPKGHFTQSQAKDRLVSELRPITRHHITLQKHAAGADTAHVWASAQNLMECEPKKCNGDVTLEHLPIPENYCTGKQCLRHVRGFLPGGADGPPSSAHMPGRHTPTPTKAWIFQRSPVPALREGIPEASRVPHFIFIFLTIYSRLLFTHDDSQGSLQHTQIKTNQTEQTQPRARSKSPAGGQRLQSNQNGQEGRRPPPAPAPGRGRLPSARWISRSPAELSNCNQLPKWWAGKTITMAERIINRERFFPRAPRGLSPAACVARGSLLNTAEGQVAAQRGVRKGERLNTLREPSSPGMRPAKSQGPP